MDNAMGKTVAKPQQGFSLVELMIALLLSSLLVLAVLQVFVGSTVTYALQSSLAKAQENGRFALMFLTRDIRQAGYSGCSQFSTLANTVRDSSDVVLPFLDMSLAVAGQDNMNGSDSFNRTPLAGTDLLEVRFADPDNSCDIDAHNPSSATLHCEANHSFKQGDILLVTDCQHTAVFQQNNVNNNNTISVISHNTGNSTTPGNCTKGLGSPVDCTTSNGTAYQFTGGVVMKMAAYRFYIANNSLGEPALYREGISNSSGSSGTTAVELVEGVEDMQILYGEDSSGDGSVDYYVPFDHISESTDIVTVRVSVLVRSIEDGVVQGDQSLTFNGATQTYSDGRLRKVFTTTVALRNRL